MKAWLFARRVAHSLNSNELEQQRPIPRITTTLATRDKKREHARAGYRVVQQKKKNNQ